MKEWYLKVVQQRGVVVCEFAYVIQLPGAKMSEQGGPERRRALRHRVGKPYAKKAKPAPAPKVCALSLLRFMFLTLSPAILVLISAQHLHCSV